MSLFIKMQITSETLELLKDKNSFVLLTQIALRARWKTGCEQHNGISVFLEKGQAFIGDFHNCGLTEKEYRNAKDRLVKRKCITVKGANKGTIATLVNNDVFDVFGIEGATRGQPNGEQRATNHNERIIDNKGDSTFISNDAGKEQTDLKTGKEFIDMKIEIEQVEEIYRIYPGKDSNNNGRSTGKCGKNKDKIRMILLKGYPLRAALEMYLNECNRSKQFLKNFTTFLNNLPETEDVINYKNDKKSEVTERNAIKYL